MPKRKTLPASYRAARWASYMSAQELVSLRELLAADRQGAASPLVDEDGKPYNIDDLISGTIVEDTAAQFHAVADHALRSGLSIDEFQEAIEDKLAAKAMAKAAAREATGRVEASPRPDAAEERTDRAAAQSVFGDIPANFLTRPYTKGGLPDAVVHDPNVVEQAKHIVNANRRTKISELDGPARKVLRTARRIVRANESQNSPAPGA